MSFFLDDDHHIDIALMAVPSLIGFAVTLGYLKRRVPWQRIKEYLNIKLEESKVVFESPRHDMVLMLVILMIYVLYHLAWIVFSTVDLYTILFNGGDKHVHEEPNLILFGIIGCIIFSLLWMYLKYFETGGFTKIYRSIKRFITWSEDSDLIWGESNEIELQERKFEFQKPSDSANLSHVQLGHWKVKDSLDDLIEEEKSKMSSSPASSADVSWALSGKSEELDWTEQEPIPISQSLNINIQAPKARLQASPSSEQSPKT